MTRAISTACFNLIRFSPHQRQITPKWSQWVVDLAQGPAIAWDTVDRPTCDVQIRFPSLRLEDDLVKVVCRLAQTPCPLPLTASVNVFIDGGNKMPIDVPAKEETSATKPVDTVHFVRLLFLSGVKETAETQLHLAKKLNFVITRNQEGKLCLPGGEWNPKIDKGSVNGVGITKAAARICKNDLDVDLSGVELHRFLEITYVNEAGMTYITHVLIPEIWKLADLPLKPPLRYKEEVVDLQETVIEDIELTQEEIDAKIAEVKQRLENYRTQSLQTRPGEREMDRLDRLDRLDGQVKELEKKWMEAVPKVRKVPKQVTVTKTLQKTICAPSLMSLQQLMDLPQNVKSQGMFEMKLAGLCVDEMIKRTFGLQIAEWLKDFKEQQPKLIAERDLKRKRRAEEVAAITKELEEYAAKKRKVEETNALRAQKLAERQKAQEAKAAAAAAAAATAEKAAEKKDEPGEGDEKKPEETSAPAQPPTKDEPQPEVVEEEIPEPEPLPEPPMLTLPRVVYEADETKLPPFQYFDNRVGAPVGWLDRTEMKNILYSIGDRCLRECTELLAPTLPPIPGAVSTPQTAFSYKMACSIEKELQEKISAGIQKPAVVAPTPAAVAEPTPVSPEPEASVEMETSEAVENE